MSADNAPAPIPFRSEEPTEAELMYSSNPAIIAENARSHFGEDIDRVGDHLGLNEAGRNELLTNVATALNDAKIGATLQPRIVAHMVAGSINRPDEATIQQWATESRRQLRERFSDADLSRRIATVERYVAARPAFGKLLTESGAGSHPDVVLQLIENAHMLRVTPMPMPKAKASPASARR